MAKNNQTVPPQIDSRSAPLKQPPQWVRLPYIANPASNSTTSKDRGAPFTSYKISWLGSLGCRSCLSEVGIVERQSARRTVLQMGSKKSPLRFRYALNPVSFVLPLTASDNKRETCCGSTSGRLCSFNISFIALTYPSFLLSALTGLVEWLIIHAIFNQPLVIFIDLTIYE